MNERAVWWFFVKLRQSLLEIGLPMPPRAILDMAFKDTIANMPGCRDGELMASVVFAKLLPLREQFSDPEIIMSDLKAWHTPRRGRAMNSLPHREFLKLWYWLSLSSYFVAKAKTCSRCLADRDTLQVHHLHYRFKGFELFNPDCLQVLCKPCHEREHGIQQATA